MSIGILGKKLGMTYILDEQGNPVAVTVVESSPCPIAQVKSKQKDGYSALQIGFQEKKKNIKKPLLGHFKKAAVSAQQFLKEIRISSQEESKFQKGQFLKADIFAVGDYVDISGVSKGKGFQGGVKRWGWKGGPKSHGSMFHRRVGSIGASSDPSRVLRGQHMPGRMGNAKTTVKNLRIAKIDAENNILCIRGGVPGHRDTILMIKRAETKK